MVKMKIDRVGCVTTTIIRWPPMESKPGFRNLEVRAYFTKPSQSAQSPQSFPWDFAHRKTGYPPGGQRLIPDAMRIILILTPEHTQIPGVALCNRKFQVLSASPSGFREGMDPWLAEKLFFW